MKRTIRTTIQIICEKVVVARKMRIVSNTFLEHVPKKMDGNLLHSCVGSKFSVANFSLRFTLNYVFFPREPENTPMDFKDAINHGIKLAVEENNPHVKLMPVGKLRKFDRVYNYDHHPFKQKNSNFRLVLLRIFIDLLQNFL